MARVWSSRLATACATVALAVGGCGDHERRDPGAAGLGSGGSSHVGGGAANDASGAAGEFAGEGQGAVGGTRQGSGGSSRGGSGGSRPSSPHGGSGDADSGGTGDTGSGTGGTNALGGTGEVTSGGSAGAGAEAGDVGLGGTGNGGTGGNPIPDQLDVCVRQETSPNVLGWDVSHDFEYAVNSDCRVGWVRYLYFDPENDLNDRVKFLNRLISFGLGAWGCVGSSPPQSFDLIAQPVPLSVADVAVLIDHYIEVATEPLSLSPGEIDDMRALLGKLAEPLLMQPDPGDFSASSCAEAGSGGESGAGGHAGSG